MKKYLFMLLSFALVMQSCGISQKQKEQAVQDSIIAAAHKRQVMIDSIANKEQNIAIGEIKFGISSKEFDTKSEVLVKDLDHQLGAYRFEELSSRYYHEGLYAVRFMGARCYGSHEYNNIIPDQFDALYSLLKRKYLEPIINNGHLETEVLEEGDNKLCAWVIGDKRIDIYINCHGEFYRLDLEIINLKALDAMNKEFHDEEKRQKEKEKELNKKAARIL